MDELLLLPLEDVAKKIAAKEISPVELTEAQLARIDRINPQLNAYMTVTAEQALEDARAAGHEIAAGRYRGLLHGVPVAVKDLFATKGVRTTAGSKILTDWVPDHDATVVVKLRDAGAVLLGKLGMHEWAFGTTSDNVHFGPVRNPWDTTRVPGGSSGGSGAATAAGLAFATLGSDTGGSIRIPAAECGCVGLMPTYGRVSLHGAVPLSWTLDHVGPLTRTVRDAAIVLQLIAGHDPLDPSTSSRELPDWLGGIERGPKGLRIGVPTTMLWDDLDPEVEGAARKALSDLEAAGAQVREVAFPEAVEYAGSVGNIIVVEAAAYHVPNYPSRKDDYSPQVGGTLAFGGTISGVAYVQAMRVLEEARRGGADAAFGGIDVMAFPTMAEPPPTIEALRADERVIRRTRSTGLWDLTGQPVMSVPCGVTSRNEKLPVAISFAGRRWDEASVLWAGRAYEQVRGSFLAPPLA
ncbi:MAG: amidase [Dehalococcoidia bacterium]